MAPSVFLDRIVRRETVVLAAGGAVERDLTYVGDVVEALLRLARRPSDAGRVETVNVGTGVRTTMRQLLTLLEARLGLAASAVDGPLGEVDLPATQADVSRLEALLGWIPRTTVAAGMDRFVAWALGRAPSP